MERHLKIPMRRMAIAVSQLTQELTESLISELIEPDASYQIIPGFIQTMNYQIDSLLLALLPHSENRLIDVCLPYICTRNGKSSRLLARYILLNKKLWGIKVCEHSQCKFLQVENQAPPIYIQKYYRENNISFSMNEVLVGHFYLQLHNCRISLIFETELINNKQLLDVYHRYRCDIYSVMSNLQKDINKDSHSFKTNAGQEEAIKSLQDFTKQHSITAVYAGFKIISNLNCVYWENAFIQQGNAFIQSPPLLLGSKNNTVFLCDLELTLRNRVIIIDEQQFDNNPEAIIEALYVNYKLKYLDKLSPKQEKFFNSKKYFKKWEGLLSLTLLNLWYLFKTVNEGAPFVISFPFTQKCRELFDYLRILSEYSLIKLQDSITIYSTSLNNDLEVPDVIIYKTIQQLLEVRELKLTKLIYLYTDEPQEIRRLKSNKNYTKLICFCQSLIPIIDKEVRANGHNNKSSHLNNQKIESACTHVLKERYQTIDQMLQYFTKLNFTKNDVQKSFLEVLPNKIRKFLKLIPLYVFLLHSQPQQIIIEVGEAELRLKSRPQSINEQVLPIQVDQSKILLQKIEAAKNYKNRVSGHLKCHRCDILFKKDLIYQCGICQNILCFDCIDVLMHHALFAIESYKCILCKGNCGCSKCQINKVAANNSQMSIDKTLSNKDRASIFNRGAFSCSFCQIIGHSYSFIKIECNQCKQLRCYSCSKLYKPIDWTKQKDWICRECDQFNMQILKQTKMQQESIHSLPSIEEADVSGNHKADQKIHSSQRSPSNDKTPIVTSQENKQNHKQSNQSNPVNEGNERNAEKQKNVQRQENKVNFPKKHSMDAQPQKAIDKSSQMIVQQSNSKEKESDKKRSGSRSRSRENKFKHKREKPIKQKKKRQFSSPSSSSSSSFSSSSSSDNEAKRKQQKEKIWQNKDRTKSIWSGSRNDKKAVQPKSSQQQKKNDFIQSKKRGSLPIKSPQNKGGRVTSSLIFNVANHKEEHEEEEEHSY